MTSAQDGLVTSVGVYVDGVYLGRPGMALEDLIDVDQIEVLRGPQGTLYGRNSSAGAINITTKAPSFTPSLTAELSSGSYTYNQERFTATGPLIDGLLAFRLTGFNTYRDGYALTTRPMAATAASKRSGVRGQLLLTPLSNLPSAGSANIRWKTTPATPALSPRYCPIPSGPPLPAPRPRWQTGWTPLASNATGINAIQDMRTRRPAPRSRSITI